MRGSTHVPFTSLVWRLGLAAALCCWAIELAGPISKTTLPAYASGAPTSGTILIDPGSIRRTLPNTFFGINYSAYYEPAEGSRASARALAQTPIRVVRFPGGSPADSYDWQDPQTYGTSHTSPLRLWTWARSFGATHILFQTNFRGNIPNPPGRSYAANSPQNAAAWVQYDQRLHIPAAMEVGNEEDWHLLHRADDPAYQTYIDGFNAQARAMHQVDPHLAVLGPVGMNVWYWLNLDGLKMFLRGAGNRYGSGQVGGITLHFYDGSDWNNAMRSPQWWLSPHGPWAAIENIVRAYDTRRLPVYITEWNLGNRDQHNTFTPTLGHALAVADMIGAFAVSGVAGQDYFTIHRSDGWGLLYGAHDARPADSPMPTYYAMALWDHMGRRVLASQQTDDAASVLSSYATSGKSGSIRVLLVNKRPTAHHVVIELQRRSPAGHRLHIYRLSGAAGSVSDLDAIYDGVRMPSPQHRLPGPINGGVVHGNRLTYTIAPYSAVVLDLAGTTPAPRLRWPALPAPVAVPPLKVTVSGAVGARALRAGQTQAIGATVASTGAVGSVIVDMEVYDSQGARVCQKDQTVSLSGVPVTVSGSCSLSSTAWSGTYHLKVGVFGANWTPLYAWNDNAATFAVDGVAWPKVRVAGTVQPSSVSAGDQVTLAADISTQDAPLTNALVDFKLYEGSKKVWQTAQTSVSVPEGASRSVSVAWTVPMSATTGSYVLKVGVFGATWKPLYAWNDAAASFIVK
ncbi:MAG TPA: hypothetical protein VFB58_17045 [Chloroflexota bacterium]|nr:hypothetical protein [Chloroflexota bacterium]